MRVDTHPAHGFKVLNLDIAVPESLNASSAVVCTACEDQKQVQLAGSWVVIATCRFC